MTRARTVLISIALAAFVAVSFSSLLGPAAGLTSARATSVAPTPTLTGHTTPMIIHATPKAAVGTSLHRSAAGPSASNCPTPNFPPQWNNPDFFHDIQVQFSVPGSPLLGQGFQMLPCSNSLPTYTNGFWLNITTTVPISQAIVDIWGSSWPTQSNPSPPISGFTPGNVTGVPMHLIPPFYHTASFFFNDYRFFWPGAQVYFNLTVESPNATPSIVYSAHSHSVPIPFTGGINNATWGFGVASPWSGANVFNPSTNLSKYISVTTVPFVLGTPAYAPNPQQPLQIILQSYNATGGPASPIPRAKLNITLFGGSQGGGTFSVDFGPINHTTMELPTPIGPYPGSQVNFSISAWMPWQTGVIDYVYSPIYHFNWSTNGGWWYPDQGLEQNLQMSTSPNLLGLSSAASLPTGTPVNVTIHEPIENVTIGSAELHFHYWDASGSAYGAIPMRAENPNSSFALIPGLPSGGHMTFSVAAKDIYSTALSSGNLSYGESGLFASQPPAGYGTFFFEAVDLATGNLVPDLNFTIANGSWSQSSHGTPMGFGFPSPLSGTGFLNVAYGVYLVTIHAFGQVDTATLVLSPSQSLTPLVFYVTSGPVPSNTWVPQNTVPIAGALGLICAVAVTLPLMTWFAERRAKAKEEQKRISL